MSFATPLRSPLGPLAAATPMAPRHDANAGEPAYSPYVPPSARDVPACRTSNASRCAAWTPEPRRSSAPSSGAGRSHWSCYPAGPSASGRPRTSAPTPGSPRSSRPRDPTTPPASGSSRTGPPGGRRTETSHCYTVRAQISSPGSRQHSVRPASSRAETRSPRRPGPGRDGEPCNSRPGQSPARSLRSQSPRPLRGRNK